MWPEPLTPDTIAAKYAAVHRVLAGDGRVVARVLTAYNADAGTGMFGEMQILDLTGGPRQRVRALALLVREALRHGAAIGIREAYTDVPDGRPALLEFAIRLSGRTTDVRWSGGARRIGGPLHEMRTAALDASDADGNLLGDPIANL